MLVLSLAILVLGCLLLSVHAQTTNVSTAQPIRTTEGTCLSVNTSLDNTAVTIRPCDNSKGQKWDVSTRGPHIIDDGFAIIILSGTSACLDAVAFNNSPGLFSCGGIAGGSGTESLNQAFTYSTFADVNGPLVFIPKSGWITNGQGPGQRCLSAEQNVLGTAPCDPSKPAPQQQFFIGSTNTSTSSTQSTQPQPTSSSGATPPPGKGSPSKRSVNPVAVAVPIVVVALIAILIAFFFVRRRRSAKERADKIETRSARPFLATPSMDTTTTTTIPQVSGLSKGGIGNIGSGSSLTSPPAQTAASSGTAASIVLQDSRARQNSTQAQPESLRTVDPGINTTDIDHIVSLVASRIDASTHPHHADASLTSLPTNTSPSYPSPAPSPGLPTAVSPSTAGTPPPANVNIDTILSLLAARVDPSFRAQTDVRDSQDVPPSYRVPPGYDG